VTARHKLFPAARSAVSAKDTVKRFHRLKPIALRHLGP
jgi:hypothetical protein